MTQSAISLYQEGKPLKVIARILGISISGVNRNLLDSPGYIPNRICGTRIRRDISDSACRLESEGKSWRSISLELGISVKALKRAIKYYAAQDSV